MTHYLIPQFILEQYTRGHFHGRFHAAALMLDISGFTATTNTFMGHGIAGAEAMADVMQSIFDPLVEAVYAHGGFIANFAGDAFTAIFPESGESHPLAPQAPWQALAAATAMQRQLSTHPERATPYGVFDFAVKFGLGSGAVEWGIVGEPEFAATDRLGERRQAYYFRGPAIDHCAAAESRAGANQLILHPTISPALTAGIETFSRRDGFQQVTAVTGSLPSPDPIFLPPADPHAIAAFVPEEILQQQARGEYRHVTTLFLNLRDVDTYHRLLPFAQTIFALQRDYGGYLNTIDFSDKGATLLLFWGMPVSYENDVERALNFALTLREQTTLTFRAGVTYHLMYAGFVGASRWRQEYSCYGQGVNLAARLTTAAPWNEIWTDQAFAQQGQSYFDLKDQGRFSFKGFGQPQPVYALSTQRASSQPNFAGRTVGRQTELGQLAGWIRPLLEGRFAGTLLVQGEAGIGKTRLVHSFQQQDAFWRQHRVRPQWFRCQTDQILRRSLNPFRDLLRQYFRQEHSRSLSANREAFARRFRHLEAQTSDPALRRALAQAHPYLQALLRIANGSDALTAQTRFENVQLALQTLLQAESKRHPLIIHLEDAHWLDEDTRRFLPQLIQALGSYPVAFLLTGREELTSDALPLPEPVQVLELGPLGPAAVTEVARQLLKRPPSPRLRRLLLERSDGNPFFAEQILLYLQTSQGLPPDELKQTDALLPLDVRAILVARLDQLAQTVKEVVQRAAVLGREFDVKLLSHMLQGENGQLTQWIQAAEEAAIWESLTQLRYIFRHAMLRDAAYDMQLQARRRTLHQVAASAIRQLYAADLAPHYGELAYHYNQAGDEVEERHFAGLAGREAAQHFANAEAARYLSQALALTPDDAWEARFPLLLLREEVYHVQGKRTAQEADLAALTTAVSHLDQPQQKVEVLLRQARYANARSDYKEGIKWAETAVAEAAALSDTRLESEARLALGRALWWRGDYRPAQAELIRALTGYQQIDHALGAAESRHQLGTMAYQQGKIEVSRRHYRHALAVYQELGDQMRQASLLNNLGSTYYFEGRYPEALDYYEQTLAIRQRIGHRQGMGGALLNIAVCQRGLGQYAVARQRLERALRISREIGERNMESVILINLTLLYHEMGQDERAWQYGRRALIMAQRIEADNFTAFALAWLGHVETALGNRETAVAHYEEAIRLRRQMDQPHLVVEPLAGLARIALQRHDAAQAQEHAATIYAAIRRDPELTGAIQPLRVYLTCYQGLKAAGDNRADAVLQRAYALLQERAALIDDEETRRRFRTAVSAHRQIDHLWQEHDGGTEQARER